MKKISREVALFLLENNLIDDSKGLIVCKGFADDGVIGISGGADFVEVMNEDLESLKDDEDYKDFEVWIK